MVALIGSETAIVAFPSVGLDSLEIADDELEAVITKELVWLVVSFPVADEDFVS